MERESIRAKFGDDYEASDCTFRMGLDVRFSNHIADRFAGSVVLEACAGGGFTSISLARRATHVFSIEIDPEIQKDAKRNAVIAGVAEKITFIRSDIFDVDIDLLPRRINAAFIDPDCTATGNEQISKFQDSATRPPSDWILEYLIDYTENITLVQPRTIDTGEFNALLPHELEKLYISGSLELYCLHFGELARVIGESEFRI
jgi:trimethylguanosine synthase